MKDEEMAGEYAKPFYNMTRYDYVEERTHVKEAYLAGLKAGSQLDEVWHDYDAGEDCYEDSHEGRWVKREAGRPQWHDFRKDPNDLPPMIRDERKISNNVWLHIHNWGTEEGYYDYRKCSWIVRCRIVDLDVVAWYEIPQFKE